MEDKFINSVKTLTFPVKKKILVKRGTRWCFTFVRLFKFVCHLRERKCKLAIHKPCILRKLVVLSFLKKKLVHVDMSNFSVRCHIDRLFNTVKFIKHHMSVVHDISTISIIPTNT